MLVNRYKKRLLFQLLLLIGIFMVGVASFSFYAKWKVANFLAQGLPDHLELSYTDLQVHPFLRNLEIRNICLSAMKGDISVPDCKIEMDAFTVEGFSFWKFLFKNEVQVGGILLKNPLVLKYPKHKDSQDEMMYSGVGELRKPFYIGDVNVQNGKIRIMHQNHDSIFLSAKDINLTLSDVRLDSNSMKNGIPFNYRGIAGSGQDLFLDLNAHERLEVKKIALDSDRFMACDLSLYSKYSKRALSNILESERDHVNLFVPEFVLDSFDFGFNDDNYFLTSNLCRINQPKVEIYRDKLVEDNLKEKMLCGKILRELPFDLTINKVLIDGGQLVYEELVHANSHAGRLFFEKLSVQGTHLSNTYGGNERTSIVIDGSLMGNARMTLDWSFDVNSIDDAFTAAGTILDLDAGSVDPFLEPCIRCRARGYVDEIYFTVSGNSVRSTGDMKMKYSDFEVVILKRDGMGVNKFLTALGNVFVKKESKADQHGYRYGRIEVEREPDKSFFSYLWVNVRDGLASTMTGSGKRE